MVTFGSHVGNHQFQPFLSGVYAGVIFFMCHIFDFVILSFNCVFFPNNCYFHYIEKDEKAIQQRGSAGSDGDIGARCIQYTF